MIREPILVFSTTILHFINVLKGKNLIHRKGEAGCLRTRCKNEVLNELSKFSSASQLENKNGANPMFLGAVMGMNT